MCSSEGIKQVPRLNQFKSSSLPIFFLQWETAGLNLPLRVTSSPHTHPSPTACSQRRRHSTRRHRSPSLSALQEALRKPWYEESPGRIAVREAKPPNPANSPHQVAKDHKTCAAAKKSQRDRPPPSNGLRSQKARLCLGPLLSHRLG